MGSTDYVIEVHALGKKFREYQSQQGKKIFLASLRRKYSIKHALTNVSFKVKKGDIVMLLGENGSGKSTLIKILTGILHPDSGSAQVLGLAPWSGREKLAWDYGMVSGAHNQLFWNLPAIDTFDYVRGIYEIPKDVYKKRLDYYIKILNLKDVFRKPVRVLSLGERMKCNFVASVLHMPKIVFMDEATIGMDLSSVINVREAVMDMRKNYGTTFFITTHIVDEIKALAKSVIIIDKGKIVFDGSKRELQTFFGNRKQLEIHFDKQIDPKNYAKYGKVVASREDYLKIEIDSKHLKNKKIVNLLNSDIVLDYNVSEPDIGQVLAKFYNRGRKSKR
ncbi:MAG: ABC transporter ATP-binding protein [Candidatus Micrarchaeales archaeon]